MMATTALQPQPAHELRGAGLTQTHNGTDSDASREQLPVPRGPANVLLSFYQPPEDGSNPHNYVEPLPGVPQRNYGADDVTLQIHDIRGKEDTFTLDANAFAAFRSVPSAMTYADWEDDSRIQDVYYAETEALLLSRLPGANRVIFFDHTIRRSHPDAKRAPVIRVHIDQTPSAAAQRVRRHAPEDADQLLRGRYRIVNVWRPLNGPVYAHPLGVADSSTVRDEDLVAVEHRYPDRVGETAAVRYHPDQRWWYWSGMENDERLLLKCFDSDETFGPNGRVPHSAFEHPGTPEGAPGRESIEVRALVFG